MKNERTNLRIALFAVSFVLVAVCALIWFPTLMVQMTINESTPGDLDQEALTTAITTNRQAVLFAIGGAIAVFTLMLSMSKHTLDRDSNTTSRYTAAIAQLGDESLPIRLGGIYALERIAQDSLRDRQTILDVLCAYLRHMCPMPEHNRIIRQKHGADISAAVAVIRRITILSKPLTPVNLSKTRLGKFADFEQADFTDADLTGSDLSGSNFKKTKLIGANLSNVDISVSDLRGADLSKTLLLRTNLSGSLLKDANLSASFIESSVFESAELERTNVAHAYILDSKATGPDGQATVISKSLLESYGAIGTNAAIF